MRVHKALIVPPALLLSGCGPSGLGRPSTPSVAVDSWQAPPRVATVDLPGRDQALRQWQLPPSDPWSVYAKYTLLTALGSSAHKAAAPDVMSLDDVVAAGVAGRVLGENGVPSDTLFIVDLRGAASVAFGAALSRACAQAISLVPTFNNWPGDDELVPAEETLAALSAVSPRPVIAHEPTGLPTTPVFLLDAWRLAYRFDDPGEDTYDNRYILTPADLPDATVLRSRGITRVVYVVESLSDTAVEEDDVHATFFAWQAAGVPIAMVDLPRLARPILPDRWDDLVAQYALLVQPRATVLDDPTFFVLARGGFGGIHAQPSPAMAGGTWIGWHGGGG